VDVAHLTGLLIFFYADDGRTAGTASDAGVLQKGLNIIIELFRRMGLQMNQAVLGHNTYPPKYARDFDRSLPTQRERALQKGRCPQCPKFVNRSHLKLHMPEAHNSHMLQIPPDILLENSHTHLEFLIPVLWLDGRLPLKLVQKCGCDCYYSDW
jgi:hypothetical protein